MLTTHRSIKTKNDIKWEEKFNLLCEYKEEFGDCNVPSYYIYKGVRLGKWCNTQRQAYKGKGAMAINQERIDKLQSIGFCLESADKKDFDDVFNILCEYKEEFGDCNVPYNYIYNGVKLGLWVCAQRQAYKGKGGVTLTQDKINKLNSIGFIWDHLDNQWNENFNLLCEYKEEFGDCNVPKEYIYKGVRLGKWCNTQRQAYKGKGTAILNQERIDKLQSIGFYLESTDYNNFDDVFNILCEYKEEFGDCNVPSRFIYKGFRLGEWCQRQRQAYKGKGTVILNQERINKLQSIGFKWKLK